MELTQFEFVQDQAQVRSSITCEYYSDVAIIKRQNKQQFVLKLKCVIKLIVMTASTSALGSGKRQIAINFQLKL
ncbi:hypothetical protein T01_7840 [Trichinella spiralis]|uniref:Uncharacterized protein n=1 Tax=Trichinella spiralis TaxID=6334 RepID=A0A0V1B4N0_TRISP|nr:hypothetical protein T01_7840 [Trichinella spiralis]